MKKFLIPLLFSQALFAQAEEVVVQPQSSYWQTIMMVAIAILFFYFILWRPEQKRKKALETQRGAMKKGDRITAMGIIGTLVKVSSESPTVIVKMYDGSKIEMLKAAISEVHPATEEEARKEEANEAKEA